MRFSHVLHWFTLRRGKWSDKIERLEAGSGHSE
jgi:hypothetical protein